MNKQQLSTYQILNVRQADTLFGVHPLHSTDLSIFLILGLLPCSLYTQREASTSVGSTCGIHMHVFNQPWIFFLKCLYNEHSGFFGHYFLS